MLGKMIQLRQITEPKKKDFRTTFFASVLRVLTFSFSTACFLQFRSFARKHMEEIFYQLCITL